MFSYRLIIILSLSLFLFACSSDSEAEKRGKPTVAPTTNTSTVELVYISDRGNGPDIYKNSINGNQEVQLTNTPEKESNPQWIGERRLLTYSSVDAAGNKTAKAMDVAGTSADFDLKNLKEIIPSPTGDKGLYIQKNGDFSYIILKYLTTKADTVNITPVEAYNGRPQWSKRGDRIVFLSDRSGSTELYIYSLSDNKTTQLTDNDWEESYASWSPTDRYIAATIQRDTFENDIYLFDLPTKGLALLANTPHVESEIAWSPISDHIAFRAKYEGKDDIFVIHVESKEIKKITKGQGSNSEPEWIVR